MAVERLRPGDLISCREMVGSGKHATVRRMSRRVERVGRDGNVVLYCVDAGGLPLHARVVGSTVLLVEPLQAIVKARRPAGPRAKRPQVALTGGTGQA